MIAGWRATLGKLATGKMRDSGGCRTSVIVARVAGAPPTLHQGSRELQGGRVADAKTVVKGAC